METRNILIIFTLSVLAVVLLSVFLIRSPYLSPIDKTACKTLLENPEGKINLVFFSSKEEAKEYSDYLLSFSPFNQYKKIFNIYYQDSYQPECEYYKDVALLCYNRNLIRQASTCPNDYIFVIKDEIKQLRSSSYLNVMSIEKKTQKSVIVHEFGHSFGNFAEEYFPADLPSGTPNCQASCEKFGENKDGCFKGCSKSDYYRSIESGIMRTLSSKNFGKFNEQVLINKIPNSVDSDTKITGKAIDSLTSCNQPYYLIEGIYNTKENKVHIKQKEISYGCPGSNGNGEFDIIITDKNNQVQKLSFSPEFIFTDEQHEKEENIIGETYKSDKPFYIKVPVQENGKELIINKNNIELAKTSLNDYRNIPCKIQ